MQGVQVDQINGAVGAQEEKAWHLIYLERLLIMAAAVVAEAITVERVDKVVAEPGKGVLLEMEVRERPTPAAAGAVEEKRTMNRIMVTMVGQALSYCGSLHVPVRSPQ